MDRDELLNTSAKFWRESSSELDFENIFSDSQGSSAENSPFRGFEKTPKVLIKKFDIEPFLKELKESKKSKINGKHNTLPQLVSSCFVKLAKEDLNQLKQDLLEYSRLNKIKTKGILTMPLLHCKICEKAYSSEKKLQNHLENKHMLVYKAGITCKPQKRVSFSDHVIVHELKEYHRCRKCTRIFEEYRSLKSHMKQEHRKRKCYICHYCSKNFVDRMFFKVHIRHHCDVCGLLLPNKRRYLIHRRDSCRVVKKYHCKTCQNMFFSYMDLKDHSYDHLEDLFICDICKDQHSTKCAVSHHISFLHSKNRPVDLYSYRNLGNEKLYLCNFCEISSIDKDVIDKHVSLLPDLTNRKRTGYKDYYFCDQCLRKFDTETDMLQHKWSHFLNPSDNSQIQSEQVKQKHTPVKTRNEIRRIYKMNEKLPTLMQPKIVLERLSYVTPQDRIEVVDLRENIEKEHQTKDNVIDINYNTAINDAESGKDANANKELDDRKSQEVGSTDKKGTEPTYQMEDDSSPGDSTIDLTDHEEVGVIVKKAIVDPKSKKTLISRFQCEKCHKFYSSNYCLNRHKLSVHQDYTNLQCKVCEETFVWPSLLKSHNCIRMNPDMSFDDARPEIQFDNYSDFGQGAIDELMNISENEDYIHSVDFDIPAPVVQLGNYGDSNVVSNGNCTNQSNNYSIPIHNSYKIIMQEVPIEF